jgi:hypothetical protein
LQLFSVSELAKACFDAEDCFRFCLELGSAATVELELDMGVSEVDDDEGANEELEAEVDDDAAVEDKDPESVA